MKNKITIEKDYIGSEYHFKELENCNPPHDMKISLSRSKHEEDEYYDFCLWGKWGEEDHQFDLSFDSKNECLKFLQDMIKVVKADYLEDN